MVKLPGADLTERTTIHTAITDEFIAMSVDRINIMLEPAAKQDISLLQEAHQEVAKCDLHFWVCQQNLEKGLAPSMGAIIHFLVESVSPRRVRNNKRRELLDDQRPTSGFGRWTRRWCMPKSKIQDRDKLSASVLRRKVTVD